MALTVAPASGCYYRCLGPAQLLGPGGIALRITTRKQAALLYYLARQSGKSFAREEITELLWPDYSEAEARHTLSQTVSLIVKEIGKGSIDTRRGGGLTLREGVIALDVNEFEGAVRSGDHDRAHELWRGRLLEGLAISSAPDFEQWLAAERGRVERLYREVLHGLGEKRRVVGDWEGMANLAERLLELDPLDEKAMLLYLESLTLKGDRTLALRSYAEFETRLREELGAEPAASLSCWATRARQRATPTPGPLTNLSRPVGAIPAPTRVFGRETEYARLFDLWSKASRGSGTACVVVGEPGIGKTALVSKLANQVQASGGSVCYVHCYGTEKSVPFAPVSALIRQLAKQTGFVATSPHHLAELTGVASELLDVFPHLPSKTAAPDLTRYRLCDAVFQCSASVAEENPLLLVVEDLHEADEATVALLHYMIRQVAECPILTAITIRPGPGSSIAEHFIQTTSSAGRMTRVDLGPLDDPAVRRLTEALLAERGLVAEATVLDQICKKSGGNPLRVVNASLAMPFISDAIGKPSSTSNDLISLGSQPKAVADILSLLAISGRPLAQHDLASLVAVSASDFTLALDKLERQHLVRLQVNNVYLAHESYASAVVQQLSDDEQQNFHRLLAKYFQTTAPANPADWFVVASHYLAAGDDADAARSALNAASFASSLQSTREEAAALRIALDASVTVDPETVIQLAECYYELGEAERLTALAERFAPTGPSDSFATLRHLAHASTIEYNSRPLDESRSVLAEEILPELAHDSWRPSRAHVLLLRILNKLELTNDLRSFAKMVRRLSQTPEQRVLALFAASYSWTRLYDARRALRLLEQVLHLATEANMRWLEMECREGRAVLLKQAGQLRRAREAHNDVAVIASKRMHRSAEANALVNRGVAEIALGDLDAARETLLAARQIAPPNWTFMTIIDYNFGFLHGTLGDLDQAATHLARALASFRQTASKRGVLETQALLALLALRRGESGELAALSTNTSPALPGESWAVKAARAWSVLVLRSDAESALRSITLAAKAMARQDVVDWLSLRHEGILIREAAGLDCTGDRQSLADDAKSIGAAWIASVVTQRRKDVVL